MRPLRYSINVTLDGCCDHRVMIADEESHRYWAASLERADALLFGRVTDEYEFVVQPILAGHGPTLFAGLSERLELRLVGRQELRSGAVALRYQPGRVTA
jgi:hypothetical protein